MAKTPLTVVPGSDSSEVYNLSKGPESVAQRVKRLQEEAHMLALEEVQSLEAQLHAAVEKATEIAKGGDAYPAGVRELVERIASNLDAQVQTLAAIVERTWKN
jgi:preprotein translocase subunit SecA